MAKFLRFLRLLFRLLVLAGFAYGIAVGVMLFVWREVPPVSVLMLGRWALLEPVDRVWVPLDRISGHLPAAVLMSEDGQFCYHHGVDWDALNEVITQAGERGPKRGASTVPMQTARNLFLGTWRSAIRKGIEIPEALALDALWPKRRIIEVYLNIAEWGDGIYGAEAAAQHYFGKSAKSLTLREAALMATALPNPKLRNPAHPTPHQRALASIIVRRAAVADQWLDCIR
ncbi:monofunctional biosynthetic peptidoglycan transglycosylase [Methylovirgula sp. 4M-Z18]|uniref:monofunctional biosynthetic peptidoglycan transglycosylase n=1 Tax=Methylovirgula sp. 4M-Z18 TaxID=2293567 RepID=UPI000E2E4DA9|nr:monofunctional biosynthetic peptidoglycan transglycosylase [Methylovirgula sp. 4M-Z18]RFB78750.1 monofunctional biosynthetic peptidoglycan transglycosylase [Methylovirgula sp. 4M-Z18]